MCMKLIHTKQEICLYQMFDLPTEVHSSIYMNFIATGMCMLKTKELRLGDFTRSCLKPSLPFLSSQH